MFFAVKRLSNSDLGFFKFLYEDRLSGSNQKSINLNASPFRTSMYPGLREGREYPIDLRIAGPRGHFEQRLRRKIVRSDNSKNWRLDGEFVHDPEELPDRYHALRDGDFAVMRFDGEAVPEAVRLLLVGAQDSLATHASIRQWLGLSERDNSMTQLTAGQVDELAAMFSSPWDVRSFLMDEAVIEELETNGGFRTTATNIPRDLGSRAASRPKVSRPKASDVQGDMAEVGWKGEELVDSYLTRQRASGAIQDFSWVSLSDAYAPFDFRIIELDGSAVKLEVKTTRCDFEQPLYLSSAEASELLESGDHYRVLRVYHLEPSGASARYVTGLAQPVAQAVQASSSLPTGIAVRGYAIDLSRVGQGRIAMRLDAGLDVGDDGSNRDDTQP